MIEVELKAWIDDPVALEAALAARFRFAGDYRKEDVYYRLWPAAVRASSAGRGAEAGQPPTRAPLEFRLRIENATAIVTAKEKRIDNGIEVNRETEFVVSDPAAFEAFARFLGATPFVRKVKVGRLYEVPTGEATDGSARVSRPTHLELSAVDRLGTFLEIERLIESDDPAAVADARSEIRSLLVGLGINPSKIEPRYYIDMLAALDRGEHVEPR